VKDKRAYSVKRKLKYEEAGVNLEEASKTISKIKRLVESTYDRNVLSGIGPFAALYRLPIEEFKEPVLVASSDGVGTKIILHLKAGTLKAAGQDLVAMSSNDILTLGARPLFFMDYVAGGKIDSNVVAEFVEGISMACKKIGCSLIGGETAEMPGVYKDGDYDLSGFIVGIAEKERIPDAESIEENDVIIGIPSSGPHSNGYSLIRKIIEETGIGLDDIVTDTGQTFGSLILQPTVLYHPYLYPLFEANIVKSAAHITGGGFYENIPRALNPDVDAVIEKRLIPTQPVFNLLMEKGSIDEDEMYRVFNMGIGFVIVVEESKTEAALDMLNEQGISGFAIGRIVKGSGKVVLV
jgi:phosphoribosylformylglycinamidine cyclo-ligase